MPEPRSLRARKKAQTRERIADVAAGLFGRLGYDGVSMADVARAADVSEQTVYNYFAAKQELVLDRAEQFRAMYRDAVERRGDLSPAAALEPVVTADIARYRTTDLDEARGEFPAQSVASPVLRRFTLEERERQARVVAEAILATEPGVPEVVALAHAAGIVAVIQLVHDQIGRCVLDRAEQGAAAAQIVQTAQVAFASLDRTFTQLP
jgi:AcrR family transcriptional regulator